MEGANQLQEIIAKIADLESNRPDPTNALEYHNWKQQIEALRNVVKETLRLELFRSRLAAMTATRATFTYSDLQSLNYDIVIIDEASQMGLAHAAMLAPLGKQVLFAGDPKQLRPIVESDIASAKRWLGESVFTRIHPQTASTCFLDEQNRMAGPICDLVSNVFYQGKLRVAEAAQTDPTWHAARQPMPYGSMGGEHVYVKRIAQEGSPANQSWYRKLSAEYICQSIMELLPHLDASKILVLTPFREQRKLLRDRLFELGIQRVAVSTVHRAQGSEHHTVFFDPVRGASRFLSSNNGALN